MMVWESTEEKLTKKLNKEKDYLWKALEEIRLTISQQANTIAALEKSAPEHFTKTLGARNRVSTIKNQAEEKQKQIEKIYSEIESYSEHIFDIKNRVDEFKNKIDNNVESANNKLIEIKESEGAYQQSKTEIEEALDELRKLIDEKNLLSSKIESLSEQVETSEIQSKRLKNILSGAIKERNDIKELYNEIYGHIVEDDQGNELREEGLKDQLDQTYNKIKEDLSSLQSYAASINDEYAEKLDLLETLYSERLSDFMTSADKKYQAIINQIKSLLPGALTAGLATAYSDKIAIEKTQLEKHESSFNRAIFGLIMCSALPIAFMMVRVLYMQEDFGSVLEDSTTLYTMMLPVYAPILWVAYSSNKSYKLSKRLIEEYTHKEVSSRTFEGLSTQISQLGESDANSELRTKLLYNLLHVNSENPGKLISDYNNSDHPIIDAIDKSSKLADAINRLDNVPLISPLLKHINAKEKAKLEVKAKEMQSVVDIEMQQSNAVQEPVPEKATA